MLKINQKIYDSNEFCVVIHSWKIAKNEKIKNKIRSRPLLSVKCAQVIHFDSIVYLMQCEKRFSTVYAG